MAMDREEAAVVLEGLRMKHEALAKAETEFSSVYQDIVDALGVALEALHGKNEP